MTDSLLGTTPEGPEYSLNGRILFVGLDGATEEH